MNLNNDVLMTNCGVPIIFVVNKSDNPYQKYDDKTEFILRHIRKIAINYGASVIYTSTKSNTNINILYDYIFHRLFNLDLIHKSNMIDKNSYFIPSGYDRLSVLKSNDTQKDLDYEFSDKIKEEKEENKDIVFEEEITCLNESDFLKKVKERNFKSRKSMIRDNLQKGKGLLHGLNMDNLKKKDSVVETDKEKDKNITPAEKVNKFQKFMDKKESNKNVENAENKPKMSEEERKRITRESLLNKLNLNKKKK